MAFTKKCLVISGKNNVRLVLNVSPRIFYRLPSNFFCCLGWHCRYREKTVTFVGFEKKNVKKYFPREPRNLYLHIFLYY